MMIELIKDYILTIDEAQKLSDISKREENLSFKTPERIIEISKKNRSMILVDSTSKEILGCFLLTDYPPTKYGRLYERSLFRMDESLRNKGHGKTMLNELMHDNKDNFIISVTSSPQTQYINEKIGMRSYTKDNFPLIGRELMGISPHTPLHPTHLYYVNKKLYSVLNG